jgi:hypothetical protein
MEEDRIYYARRAAEERRAAQGAATEQAKRLHRELAQLFEARTRERFSEDFSSVPAIGGRGEAQP